MKVCCFYISKLFVFINCISVYQIGEERANDYPLEVSTCLKHNYEFISLSTIKLQRNLTKNFNPELRTLFFENPYITSIIFFLIIIQKRVFLCVCNGMFV